MMRSPCGRGRRGRRAAATGHQLGGGTAFQVGQDDRLAAPVCEHGGLGEVGAGVVAALGPDVGPQPAQRPPTGVSSSKTTTASTHSSASSTRARSAAGTSGRRRALEPADGVVGVEADDQAVAEPAGGSQGGDVAGVQQVEAAAGGDHGAAGRARPGRRPSSTGSRLRRRGAGRPVSEARRRRRRRTPAASSDGPLHRLDGHRAVGQRERPRSPRTGRRRRTGRSQCTGGRRARPTGAPPP